jgi:hypothetical protein
MCYLPHPLPQHVLQHISRHNTPGKYLIVRVLPPLHNCRRGPAGYAHSTAARSRAWPWNCWGSRRGVGSGTTAAAAAMGGGAASQACPGGSGSPTIHFHGWPIRGCRRHFGGSCWGIPASGREGPARGAAHALACSREASTPSRISSPRSACDAWSCSSCHKGSGLHLSTASHPTGTRR